MAYPAVARHFRREAEIAAGPLLRAELKNNSGIADHFADRFGIFNGKGERLLVVHVLACTRRRDSDNRSPAFTRRHQHGVDILAREQFAVIVVS